MIMFSPKYIIYTTLGRNIVSAWEVRKKTIQKYNARNILCIFLHQIFNIKTKNLILRRHTRYPEEQGCNKKPRVMNICLPS